MTYVHSLPCTNTTDAFREMSNTAPMRYTTSSHRDNFFILWASGDAQTHTRRVTSAELSHCSIAAGLSVEQRHSTVRAILNANDNFGIRN